MPLLRRLLFCVASLAYAAGAQANVTDTPHFKVDGVVIVWSAAGNGVQANRPTAHTGLAVHLETATDLTVTGTLVALGNPQADPLVPLKDPADGQTSFFVASNTAFNIEADIIGDAQLPVQQLENISFQMTIDRQGSSPMAFGQKAQFPHTGGATGGLATNIETLADLRKTRTLFTGNQRTARSSGTIAEQSVRFTAHYSSKTARTSSPLPNVIYTVFVP